MNYEKKLNEFYKRGLELEMQGYDPGIIGTSARMERLRARLRKMRLFGGAKVRAGKSRLKMAITGKPKLRQGRIKLELTLEMPVAGDAGRLADKASPAFRALVKEAVSDLRKSGPRGATRSSRKTGSA